MRLNAQSRCKVIEIQVYYFFNKTILCNKRLKTFSLFFNFVFIRALNEHNMNNQNNTHWNEKITKPDECLNESPFFYSGASPHNKYQTNKSEGKKLKNVNFL